MQTPELHPFALPGASFGCRPSVYSRSRCARIADRWPPNVRLHHSGGTYGRRPVPLRPVRTVVRQQPRHGSARRQDLCAGTVDDGHRRCQRPGEPRWHHGRRGHWRLGRDDRRAARGGAIRPDPHRQGAYTSSRSSPCPNPGWPARRPGPVHDRRSRPSDTCSARPTSCSG